MNIQKVMVIGAGQMGSGIAQVCAMGAMRFSCMIYKLNLWKRA